MNLVFKCTDGPGNDETYAYHVDFIATKEVTVRDLLDHILTEKKEDWGSFYLNQCSMVKTKNSVCEYKYGEVFHFNQALFDQYADLPVQTIRALGGYSRMDYYVFTEDERLILAYEKIEELEGQLEMANDHIRGLSQMVQEGSSNPQSESVCKEEVKTESAEDLSAEKVILAGNEGKANGYKRWEDGKNKYKLYLNGSEKKVGVLRFRKLFRRFYFDVNFGGVNAEIEITAKTVQEAKIESEKRIEEIIQDNLRAYEFLVSAHKEQLKAFEEID